MAKKKKETIPTRHSAYVERMNTALGKKGFNITEENDVITITVNNKKKFSGTNVSPGEIRAQVALIRSELTKSED